MRSCPNPRCKYKTNKNAQMQNHLEVTGHGRTDAGKKEFKGHLAVRGKKKSKG